jgi:hypothetical protein
MESIWEQIFSADSMYKVLIYSEIPVDNDKKIWKLKISLKTKNLVGTFMEE